MQKLGKGRSHPYISRQMGGLCTICCGRCTTAKEIWVQTRRVASVPGKVRSRMKKGIREAGGIGGIGSVAHDQSFCWI